VSAGHGASIIIFVGSGNDNSIQEDRGDQVSTEIASTGKKAKPGEKYTQVFSTI